MKKDWFILILLFVGSCNSIPETKLPEVIKEPTCELLDSIPFDKRIQLDDPLLATFFAPIDSIEKLIKSEAISLRRTIPIHENMHPIWGWYHDDILIKVKLDNQIRVNQKWEDNFKTFEYYLINECSWIYKSVRRKATTDTLLDLVYLSFNDTSLVQCIRANYPEPIRGYINSRPTSHPKLNPNRISGSLIGHRRDLELMETENGFVDIDTLKILNKNYYVGQSKMQSPIEIQLFILNADYDTVYKHGNYATAGFEFVDFNQDGILDIRIHQNTNVGGVSELVCFDTANGQFTEVENFEWYPFPKAIGELGYWYSYHRSGCADLNWGSELITIQNFKVIELGIIEGLGCEDESKNGIFIYKVTDDRTEEIDAYPRDEGIYPDKWDFIDTYWNKNYKKFR